MSESPQAAAEAGMEQALRAERVAAWKTDAARWIEAQPAGLLFTADDLVEAIGLPDTGPGRNNVVGAWIGSQRKQRRIEFTGELRTSRRVEGHGNLQRQWRVLVDGDRVGGDAALLGPDGVSSSPGVSEASAADATGPGFPLRSDPAAAAAEDVADAPPGGPPDMEPGWLLRSLQAEAAA